MDRLHTTLPFKPWPRVRQSTTKDSNAVIHTTRVPVQDLLRDERPAVRLRRGVRRERAAAVVRDVHVRAVGGPRLVGDADALVGEEDRRGGAGGEGRGGPEAGAYW